MKLLDVCCLHSFLVITNTKHTLILLAQKLSYRKYGKFTLTGKLLIARILGTFMNFNIFRIQEITRSLTSNHRLIRMYHLITC